MYFYYISKVDSKKIEKSEDNRFYINSPQDKSNITFEEIIKKLIKKINIEKTKKKVKIILTRYMLSNNSETNYSYDLLNKSNGILKISKHKAKYFLNKINNLEDLSSKDRLFETQGVFEAINPSVAAKKIFAAIIRDNVKEHAKIIENNIIFFEIKRIDENIKFFEYNGRVRIAEMKLFINIDNKKMLKINTAVENNYKITINDDNNFDIKKLYDNKYIEMGTFTNIEMYKNIPICYKTKKT